MRDRIHGGLAELTAKRSGATCPIDPVKLCLKPTALSFSEPCNGDEPLDGLSVDVEMRKPPPPTTATHVTTWSGLTRSRRVRWALRRPGRCPDCAALDPPSRSDPCPGSCRPPSGRRRATPAECEWNTNRHRLGVVGLTGRLGGTSRMCQRRLRGQHRNRTVRSSGRAAVDGHFQGHCLRFRHNGAWRRAARGNRRRVRLTATLSCMSNVASGRRLIFAMLMLIVCDVVGGFLAVISGINTWGEAWGFDSKFTVPLPVGARNWSWPGWRHETPGLRSDWSRPSSSVRSA